jgi:hypothetical protein
MVFNVSKDYSPITGLRNSNISDHSGEDFYHDKLNEVFADAYKNKDKLELVLDGSLDGYTPSFIDEAIGNLVYDFSLEVVKRILVIISKSDAQWEVTVNQYTYPKWEKRRLKKNEPTITKKHGPWYRLMDGCLKKDLWIQLKYHE